MARYVILQYLGKTDPLVLTLKNLSKDYAFASENGSKATVLYEDAQILLTDNPKTFRVASSIIEGEMVPTEDKKVSASPPPVVEPAPVIGNTEVEEPDQQETPEEQEQDTKEGLPLNMMAMKTTELLSLAAKIGCVVDPDDSRFTLIKKIKRFMAEKIGETQPGG
jgi:hypothetical protein